MMDAMATVVASLPDIEWPFFILHSEEDTITSVKGAKLMFEKAKSKDKKLKVSFPDLIYSEFISFIVLHTFA